MLHNNCQDLPLVHDVLRNNFYYHCCLYVQRGPDTDNFKTKLPISLASQEWLSGTHSAMISLLSHKIPISPSVGLIYDCYLDQHLFLAS